ncbi:MAG: hypothetical protein NTZ67_07490 [Gammaproteobacteria bacterium]|nr:hypothetical protein [Gammaproteobacteria bacterium]
MRKMIDPQSLSKDLIDDPTIIKIFLENFATESAMEAGALVTGVPGAIIGGSIGGIAGIFAFPLIALFTEKDNVVKIVHQPAITGTVAAGLISAIPGAAIGRLLSFVRKLHLEKTRNIIHSGEKIEHCCRILHHIILKNDLKTFQEIKSKIFVAYKMSIVPTDSKALFLKLQDELIPEKEKIEAILKYLNAIVTLDTKIISARKNTGTELFNIIIKILFPYRNILKISIPIANQTCPFKIRRSEELAILILTCAHSLHGKNKQFLCLDVIGIIGSFLEIPPYDAIYSDFKETCQLKETYKRNCKLLNYSNNSNTIFKAGEYHWDTINRLARYAHIVGDGPAKLTCDRIENSIDKETISDVTKMMKTTSCQARTFFRETFEFATTGDVRHSGGGMAHPT